MQMLLFLLRRHILGSIEVYISFGISRNGHAEDRIWIIYHVVALFLDMIDRSVVRSVTRTWNASGKNEKVEASKERAFIKNCWLLHKMPSFI